MPLDLKEKKINGTSDQVLILDLYEMDGLDFTIPFTKRKTVKLIQDLFKGLIQLKEKHFIHGDMKPDNLLFDHRGLSIADLNGLAFLPPFELIRDLLPEIASKLSKTDFKFYIEETLERIDSLNPMELIKFHLFCVTFGEYDFYSTNCYSDLKLIDEVQEILQLFRYNDENQDPNKAIAYYEKLRKLLESQSLHQIAITSMCMIQKNYLPKITEQRIQGVFKGIGLDPLSPKGVSKFCEEAGIPELKPLFDQMLDGKFMKTVESCYNNFCAIEYT